MAMPLGDFAKAYDGPPTDPKVFEEQQRKLQEDLQKRADEARKKLESQQGAPALVGGTAAGGRQGAVSLHGFDSKFARRGQSRGAHSAAARQFRNLVAVRETASVRRRHRGR